MHTRTVPGRRPTRARAADGRARRALAPDHRPAQLRGTHSGLDSALPGRRGRVHTPLPLRRHTSRIWPRLTRPRPAADAARRHEPRTAPDPQLRPAGAHGRPPCRARSRPSPDARSRPHASNADHLDASEVAHHDRTHETHPDLARSSSRLPIPSDSRLHAPGLPAASSPPWLPSPGSLLPGPHARARPPHACRRPASGLPPSRLGWPARCLFCRSRKGGPARQRWTPLPRKPRREAKSQPDARRRPGDLIRPPARDHHLETTSRSGEHWRQPGATTARVRAATAYRGGCCTKLCPVGLRPCRDGAELHRV
jgi:hypothetical protein